MQPYLLPYIAYWQLIRAVDKFIVYDDVAYIKQGFINRNYILLQKQKFLFTLNIINASSFRKINEIQVGNNAGKILKTVEHAYSRAKCFMHTFPVIENILLNREKNLARYITYSLKSICEYLGISTQILLSSELDKRVNLSGQAQLFNICRQFDCHHYINSIGGQALYDKPVFENQGITLKFLRTNNIVYPQFENEFIPQLSIIDMLMFNTPQEIAPFLTAYALV